MSKFYKRVTSWLFWMNFLYFQWFFVRLGRKYSYRQKEFLGWEFIGFMLPLTGWWTNYIWIWKFKATLKRIKHNRSLSKEDIWRKGFLTLPTWNFTFNRKKKI